MILVSVVVAIVVRSNVEGTPATRARGRWVLAGSVIGLGASAADLVLNVLRLPGFSSSPLDLALSLAIVLIPISVAYAVLRQHVIDVRFAINRALVYGSLTTAAVLAFSVIEWAIGKKLSDERIAGYLEIAVAAGVGFWFNLVHRRVERFFDSVFFRHQHNAARHLARVASAIPHVASIEAVDRLLIEEPLKAYRLTSAALFRRNDGGNFERVAS